MFTGRLSLESHPWLADHAVLGSVLLHVIEAAGPVNLAVDGAGRDFRGGVVDYVMGVAGLGDVCPRGVWRVNDFYYTGVA